MIIDVILSADKLRLRIPPLILLLPQFSLIFATPSAVAAITWSFSHKSVSAASRGVMRFCFDDHGVAAYSVFSDTSYSPARCSPTPIKPPPLPLVGIFILCHFRPRLRQVLDGKPRAAIAVTRSSDPPTMLGGMVIFCPPLFLKGIPRDGVGCAFKLKFGDSSLDTKIIYTGL